MNCDSKYVFYKGNWYHRNFFKHRLICLKLASYTCQDCHKKQGDPYMTQKGRKSKEGVVIQVHHPNNDRKNPRAVLVALCKQCHLKADALAHDKTKKRKELEDAFKSGQLEGPWAPKISKIPNDQHVTYQLQYRRCNKPICATCKNKEGHGPYWYAYWRGDNGKLRSAYIGKEKPREAESIAV